MLLVPRLIMSDVTVLFTLYAFTVWAGTALASLIAKVEEEKLNRRVNQNETEKLCNATRKILKSRNA